MKGILTRTTMIIIFSTAYSSLDKCIISQPKVHWLELQKSNTVWLSITEVWGLSTFFLATEWTVSQRSIWLVQPWWWWRRWQKLPGCYWLKALEMRKGLVPTAYQMQGKSAPAMYNLWIGINCNINSNVLKLLAGKNVRNKNNKYTRK